MLPDVTYWARIRGAGHHAYGMAGEQPLPDARPALSAAVRAANPGPWLTGRDGLGAVVGDGRLEAVLVRGESHDAAARGGELCGCFGVSCAAARPAIAGGASSLAAVGAATRAGTNCGSCRPEIRTLLRAARPRRAA